MVPFVKNESIVILIRQAKYSLQYRIHTKSIVIVNAKVND